jgi:hypothetical protein
MLKAIKKFFGIQEKTVWNWDHHELADLSIGTGIIDNGGRTEGGPATVWTKQDDGNWINESAALPTIVSDKYFQMPFLVVEAPRVPVI